MRSEASHLLSALVSSRLYTNILAATSFDLDNLGVDDAISFALKVELPTSDSVGGIPTENDVLEDLRSLKQQLLTTSGYLKCVQMSDLPAKLNPIILPLMASIRREQPGPVEKLVKNICSLTWMDPLETPQAISINSMEGIEEQDLLSLKSSTRTRSPGSFTAWK
ncbi:btaf1 RNA polymerase II, B-TFIID transcription factor-associated, 170kDa [Dionaea muscipula]